MGTRNFNQQPVKTLVCTVCHGPAMYLVVRPNIVVKCYECKRKARNKQTLTKGRKRTLAKSDGDVLRTIQRVRHEFTNKWIRVTAPPVTMKCRCGATAVGYHKLRTHSVPFCKVHRRETPGG